MIEMELELAAKKWILETFMADGPKWNMRNSLKVKRFTQSLIECGSDESLP